MKSPHIMRQVLKSTLLVLPLSGLAAGLSSEARISSDYILRGLSRTDHCPFVQGTLKYAFPLGIHFDLSMSNVGADEARGMEVRTELGYEYEVASFFKLALKGEAYRNPFAMAADTIDLSLEGILGNLVHIGAHHANRYFGLGTRSQYVYCKIEYEPLKAENLFAIASLGYSTFGDEVQAGSKAYMDYLLALEHRKDIWTVGLFFVDTNRRIIDGRTVDKSAHDDGFGVYLAMK